ncbi:MAG: DinB family protein [bacterium]|nr:DinB family protein [bacterium]
MEWQELVNRMEATGRILADLFAGVGDEELRWKPAPERWSMLEVLVHLWDEEKDDFRHRLALTLDDPAREWPAIDPEGWVRERRYNERDPAEALAGFRHERAASLAWLRGLDEPVWDSAHEHPALGVLRAGDLLAAWTAHDLLHIRQLSNLRIDYLSIEAAPYSTRYAIP